MANGMSGLYIGASGLTAAQAALNTTAHNLANVNTEGYTRQQIRYQTSQYFEVGTASNVKATYGIGVDISEIARVRDELIDKAYRQESGRLGYYESQHDAINEIESLFGEISDNSFQDSMKDFWTSVNEVSKNPSSTIARSSLIQTATAFINKADSIYKSLTDYQATLNTKVDNLVNKVNSLSTTINDLNNKISSIESAGESANDLRDQRDKALDDLSKIVKIQYQEGPNGVVSVSAESVPIVANNSVYKMGTQKVEGTELLVPVWPLLDNRTVFPDAEVITAISNNDIGELKGLLLARGNKAVNYTAVPVQPDSADYDLSNPTEAAAYTAALTKYDSDCDYYDKYIDPSAILSTMASLDKLVNGIVTSVNDILCPETTASFTATDGKVYSNAKVLDMNSTSYGNDADKSVGVELFARKNTSRYIKVDGQDGKTYYVRNDKNDIGLASDYTLGNIEVNQTAAQNKAKLPLTNIQGEEDFVRAQKLVDAWEVKFASLNPSSYAKETFMSFYDSLVSEFADNGKVLNNMVTNQTTMTDGYDSQRIQTEGVSSDEELQNMIKFQQAYNASARYVNVISQMLEHIVTSLGKS